MHVGVLMCAYLSTCVCMFEYWYLDTGCSQSGSGIFSSVLSKQNCFCSRYTVNTSRAHECVCTHAHVCIRACMHSTYS